MPEAIRKNIGTFRTESLLKLNEENSSLISDTISKTNLDLQNISVDLGSSSDGEEKRSTNVSMGSKTVKNPDATRNSTIHCQEQRGHAVPSSMSVNQSRYGRIIQPNRFKDISDDFKDEIILELNSDNDCDDMSTEEKECNQTEQTDITTGSRNKFGTGKLLCKYCDKRYHHIKARNKHMISEHLNQCEKDGYVHRCEECGTNFVSALGKSKHMKRVHNQNINDQDDREYDNGGKDNFILCPFEEKGNDKQQFTTIKELKAHIKDEHPDKDKSCMGCGLNCDTKEQLIEHIQQHKIGSREGRNLYSCEHCHQNFLSEYIMMTHKRNMHSMCETMGCEICGKEFKNSKFLANHMDRHKNGEISSESNNDEFCCELLIPERGDLPCGKSFKL